MTNLNFSKTDITDILHSNIAEVTFDKLDGEERVMLCTLQETYTAPLIKKSSTTRKRPQNDNVIIALDLEKNEWRSFHVDRVKALVYPKTLR